MLIWAWEIVNAPAGPRAGARHITSAEIGGHTMANTLYDALFQRYRGQASAFITLPDGAVLSHGAFVGMAAQFAHVLGHLGLQPGDRLAVQIAKSPQALAVYAACVQAGVIFLPLNTAYTAAEVAYFVENSGAKLLICDSANASTLLPVAQAAGAQLEVLNGNGTGSFADLAAGQPKEFATLPRQPDYLAAFLYTSGTTGRSKGAMLTHANLLSNAEVLADSWQFSDQDVLLHALPIFHTHGLFVATNICLLSGAQMLFYPSFDVQAILRDMPRATTMMGVPT